MNFKIRIFLCICTSCVVGNYFLIKKFLNSSNENNVINENGYFLKCDNTNPIDKNEDFILRAPQRSPYCDNSKELLIGILSASTEFLIRDEIRMSWGRMSKIQDNEIKMLFLVANDKNSSINEKVEEEFENFGDILLLNFTDHYRNLSLKTFGLINYASFYCPNVRCVLKVDSDMIVNVGGFQKLCRSLPSDKHTLSGHVERKIAVRRTIGNQYYVPYYVYTNFRYPDYASGPAYLLSGYGIATRMLKTTKFKTRFLKSENYRRISEDVIFTGDVREMANISINHVDGIEYNPVYSYWCDQSSGYRKIPLAYATQRNNITNDWKNMQNMISHEASKPKLYNFLPIFKILSCYL